MLLVFVYIRWRGKNEIFATYQTAVTEIEFGNRTASSSIWIRPSKRLTQAVYGNVKSLYPRICLDNLALGETLRNCPIHVGLGRGRAISAFLDALTGQQRLPRLNDPLRNAGRWASLNPPSERRIQTQPKHLMIVESIFALQVGDFEGMRLSPFLGGTSRAGRQGAGRTRPQMAEIVECQSQFQFRSFRRA
jgi:hypothetical protein